MGTAFRRIEERAAPSAAGNEATDGELELSGALKGAATPSGQSSLPETKHSHGIFPTIFFLMVYLLGKIMGIFDGQASSLVSREGVLKKNCGFVEGELGC